MRRVKSIAAIVVLTLPMQGQKIMPINSGQPFGACEVLQNLTTYRGKIVEIRGEWHGAYLIDDCQPLKTEDHVWPNVILTVERDDAVVRTTDPVSWRMDANAYRRAGRTLLGAAKRGQDVNATLIGRLDTRESLFLVTVGVPRPVPGGYGHLGVFPARLVINTVKDVVAVPSKKRPPIFTGDPF